jgi:hypothetical protein
MFGTHIVLLKLERRAYMFAFNTTSQLIHDFLPLGFDET